MESIIGIVHIIVVVVTSFIEQRLFMDVPIITLVASIDAKLFPVMVML